ncbi:MAG TPA: tail fiber domain-containing protein [Bacteroidia bacterium]|nr:tail fiber domain-containing protein [Bacteroidia bacterium]
MKPTNLFTGKYTAFVMLLMLLSTHGTVFAQLKLYSNGSLSIGSITQPPTNAELQVIGNTMFSQTTGTITSSAYIKGLNTFSTDSLPDYSWRGDTLTGIFHPALNILAFSNTGRESMRLSSSNNLLIGSSSDNGDRLQVTGSLNSNPFDIYSNNNTTTGYSGTNWLNDTNTKAWTVKYNGADKFYVYGNGQAYSFGWNTMSDSTLKENVHLIPNALNKVLKLEGVTYNLKQSTETADVSNKIMHHPSPTKMGLIAQSVERVVPEVVTTTSDGLKTVAYGNMVGLLIEALKEEDIKVTYLQHKLDSCISANAFHKEMSLNTINK